ALRYSRFMRAILSREISLGHSASQAPVLVQFPKPSMSIWCTIFRTRSRASGWPCGNRLNCEILAETNSMAEAFLQAATHAPHPMQVAASNESSAFSFSMGIALATWVFPDVLTDT